MKKLLAFLFPAVLAVGAFAQSGTDSHGVTTSTDPARAAAVERQASELKAAQAPHHSRHHAMRHVKHSMAQHHHKAVKKTA
ncbi:MAG TPA: hypothetical protein VLU41_01010 [Ideonella sp.]|nr:hypothetical protein [Ideonella sp.]